MFYYDDETGDFVEDGGSEFDAANNSQTLYSNPDQDYWDAIGIDPNSITSDGTAPTNDEIWEQIQGGGSWLSKLGTSALNSLKSTFTKKVNGKDVTDWRAIAGAAGGLYGLYKSGRPQEKTGYQGGIPKYEAVREKVANTYDPKRRPGSTAQDYFSSTKYVAPEGAAAARTAAKEEAAGLETLNKSNPARQERTVLQAGAEKKEAEKSEIKPASSVIKDLPVATPKYASGGLTAMTSSPYTKSPEEKEADAERERLATQTYASGGIADMAKGRYLGGATDGMADKIPARIGGKQEARLSHGEFVIPADVVGHLGNGNSEAGAKRLYEMMDRIRQARTGTTKQGKQVNPNNFLPK